MLKIGEKPPKKYKLVTNSQKMAIRGEIMYKFKKDYVNYEKNGWGVYEQKPKYITIHNTANSASAQNERDYVQSRLVNGNSGVPSYHLAIDEKEVIKLQPFSKNAWHSGDGQGQGNRNSVGIEICRSTGGDYKGAEDNCARYVAYMIDNYGYSIDNIKFHKDWSGKHCPHKMMDNNGGSRDKAMSYFKNLVKKYLNSDNSSSNDKPTDKSISWEEADKLTTSKDIDKRIKKVKISGEYPSDPNTYAYDASYTTSKHVQFPVKSSYVGWLVASLDNIVWFEFEDMPNTYLDLNKKGERHYWNNAVKVESI